MEIIKEIKTPIFDTSKFHKGDLVYITDNESGITGRQGRFLIYSISKTYLVLIDDDGETMALTPQHFEEDHSLGNLPKLEIKVLNYC